MKSFEIIEAAIKGTSAHVCVCVCLRISLLDIFNFAFMRFYGIFQLDV